MPVNPFMHTQDKTFPLVFTQIPLFWHGLIANGHKPTGATR